MPPFTFLESFVFSTQNFGQTRLDHQPYIRVYDFIGVFALTCNDRQCLC